MWLYFRSFRWFLNVLLILTTAAQMVAQETKQPPASDTANLIKQAEGGDAMAQFTLGVAYADGEGVAKDDAVAALWYRKAAEQGLSWAQFNLGFAYSKGEGVPKDNAEAVRWFRKAAEQGQVNAQYILGLVYDVGEGVPKDDGEAYFWLNLGASHLGDEVRKTRDQIGEKLTPEKRLEIQERCRKWTEAHPQTHD
jgi:TPR repeat protein